MFQFNSSSQDYAVHTTNPLQALPVFSYEVWHQWDGTTVGIPSILTDIYGGSINYALGQLDISYPPNMGKIQGGFFDQTSGWQTQSTGAPYDLTYGAWTHIVVSFDSSQILRVWVDKNLVSVTQHNKIPNTNGNGIMLMRGSYNPGFWGGALVLVNIYDKALDQYDVNNQYELNINRFT